MRNKFFSVLFTLLFCGFLLGPTVLYLTIGENTANTLDEKRTPAEAPLGFQNDFFPRLEAWYTDSAPYRSSLISFQKRLSQSYGSYYRSTIHPALSRLFTPAWYLEDGYLERVPGQPAFLAPLGDELFVYGREDWLFYTAEHNMDYFTRQNLLTEETMASWKLVLQKLNTLCQERGVHLVVLLAPNKEQVYGEYVPSYYIESAEERGEQFFHYMQGSGVTYLFPLEEMLALKPQYDLYYKQDTHWNAIGAYIGASQVLRALDIPFQPLDELTIREVWKAGGDLSNFSGYATTYRDYEVDYKPEVHLSTEYSDPDGFVEVFASSHPSKGKLVMLSDSFRTLSKGYLAVEFSRATIVHSGFLDNPIVPEAIQDLTDGDVLLLLRVERYDEDLIVTASKVIDILQQD